MSGIAESAAETNTMCETIAYYLNLRLAAKAHEAEVKLPDEVDEIINLARTLPSIGVGDWAILAAGKLPAKTKKSDAAKPRSKWDPDSKAEMVRLVEDEHYREEILGKEGTRLGHVNWAALARRYGFSGNAPVHRMYTQITGKDPPGAKTKEIQKRERPEGEEPAAKKPKQGAPEEKRASTASDDGWTSDLGEKLVRLVEDESYRKIVTGKRHLKWSRVADAVGKSKKDAKKKYEALTGKSVDVE